jgi:3-dehydroquinate synthase
LATETRAAVRVDVNTGSRTSTIWIGDGISEQLASMLDAHGVGTRRFVVSSPVIWRLHGTQFQHLSTGGEPILLPDGERYKNLQSVARVYEALIRAGADRGSAIVAVGGGVIGDTAGFAAATFLRGIALAHVPTTLLAQVDSSIGGKVGVNHALGKNMIGAFHQPTLVAIDPLVLKTLPRREFRSGLYEVVKYGMIASRALFERVSHQTKEIFARDPDVLLPAIVESCRIKSKVVSEDERESGLRRILNFGHTIGHALEAATEYSHFLHGEAVAWGMIAAAAIARETGDCKAETAERITAATLAYGPLPRVACDVDKVMDRLVADKKTVGGVVHFVLPRKIGKVEISGNVPISIVRNAVESIRNHA